MKNYLLTLMMLLFTTTITIAQKMVEIDGGLIASSENYMVGSQSDSVPEYLLTSTLILSDSSGMLFDSGGPDGPYGAGEFYSAEIDIPNALGVRLSSTFFETESPYDSMQIINSGTQEVLATLTGSQMIDMDIFGAVLINFYTNTFNNLEGFEIRWDGLYEGPVDPNENKGSGSRLQYFGDQAALRTGSVDSDLWDNTNVGKNSFASGLNSNAKGNNAAAIGQGVNADANNSLAIGKYNVGGGDPNAWNGNDPVFEIGDGTDENNRSNALTVLKDGKIGQWNETPTAGLHSMYNSSLSNPHIYLHENGNDYARMNFKNNNGDNYWTIAAYIASNNKNDRLNFWNGTSGDLMTLTGDGELGLGVGISPKVPFHIGNGRRVLWGTDTLGNGDKLMFLPDLHAFRVGTVATGAASTYWNRDSIGLYSFASGLNTRAQGFGATAMGRDTEATNSYAFASGFFSNADGQYSTAMGFNTDAFALGSTALGYSTDAEENYSFAAGYFAEAQAIYSVAIGNAVRAQSYASMAVGRYNVGGGSATSWNTSDPIFEIGIGTGPSTRANAMTVRKNGNIGIGTTFPNATLHVVGAMRVGSLEEFTDEGSYAMAVNSNFRPLTDNSRDLGNASYRWDDVYATNGNIVTSDIRDKQDIEALDYGLETVKELAPVRYKWKHNPDQGFKLGLIAQELIDVVPEVVKTHDYVYHEDGTKTLEENERMGVYYSDLIPVLINAIQQQQELIDALEARINILENQ